MKKTARLRSLLAGGRLVRAPGAFDALSAKLIAAAGFDVVYMTGYGASASVLGEPDVGLMTLTEMARRAADIANAVDLPVIADGDTGFGNAINVRRTVREYERAGVCGIQLEDQVAPKRCGHMLGREVVPASEMVQKVRAAVDARHDDDFVIVARTDARTQHGLAEALARGRAYVEAGADVVFIESPESADELRAVTAAFPGTPAVANMVEGGRTPVLSAAELQALGFALAIYPVGPLFAAAHAMAAYLDDLRGGAATRPAAIGLTGFADFNRTIGLPIYQALQDKYRS
jgi:2,3-dimethylmalate lyase